MTCPELVITDTILLLTRSMGHLSLLVALLADSGCSLVNVSETFLSCLTLFDGGSSIRIVIPPESLFNLYFLSFFAL